MGAVGALGVAIIGVIPLAAASASASASPIIAQALDGSSAPLDFRAPAFQLTNQHGHPVSLASLRGKVVLLTFLDPVCTSDCPLIAQEFRQADQLLGGHARQVELVAVVTNPVYNQPAYTAGLRPAGAPGQPAQLAVPDRQRRPSSRRCGGSTGSPPRSCRPAG